MMLSMVFVMVIMARSSAERIVEVLEETSTLNAPEHPVHEWLTAALTLNM